MQYFLQSGRIPDLSFAELVSVLETTFKVEHASAYIKQISDRVFIVELPKEFDQYDLNKVFPRFGGFIRIGYVIEDQEAFLAKQTGKKIVYGISLIQNDHPVGSYVFHDLKKLAAQIKDTFKARDIPCRFVLPQGDDLELNAAQVIKNSLIAEGFELCLIEKEDGTYALGTTKVIQDIDAYTQRDFERPYADKKMGMLPPKLARMMINLAGLEPGATIWDPFCGSGTILTEALTLGYNVVGSDIDRNALFYTGENIKWTAEKYDIKELKTNVFNYDVTRPSGKLTNMLKHSQIGAIVCEPFMGPPQKRILPAKKADHLCTAVMAQYKGLIDVVSSFGKRKIKLVIVVPAYKTFDGWVSPRISTLLSKRWMITNKRFGRDLQYRRSNSIISRNILLIENIIN